MKEYFLEKAINHEWATTSLCNQLVKIPNPTLWMCHIIDVTVKRRCVYVEVGACYL